MKITVKVSTNASKNEIISFENNILKVKLKALPIKGKANLELIQFLSKELKIKKSDLQIIQGQLSKLKVLEIRNLSQDELMYIITSYLSS